MNPRAVIRLRCSVLALALVLCGSAPASADPEAAAGFARAVAKAAGLQPTDCPDDVLARAGTERDCSCFKADVPSTRFSRTWHQEVKRASSDGAVSVDMTQSSWLASPLWPGALVRTYEVSGTPLEVLHYERSKIAAACHANYSWNAWPCPPGDDPEADPAVEPPRPIERPEPVYPEIARLAREEGSIVVRFVVDAEGRPTDVCVREPHNRSVGLEAAAVDAVRLFRFEPATLDGRPVPAVVEERVDFKLAK